MTRYTIYTKNLEFGFSSTDLIKILNVQTKLMALGYEVKMVKEQK